MSGSPLSYSRTKRSLKDRKKKAKRTRKDKSSPGNLILSDSEDENGAEVADNKRSRRQEAGRAAPKIAGNLGKSSKKPMKNNAKSVEEIKTIIKSESPIEKNVIEVEDERIPTRPPSGDYLSVIDVCSDYRIFKSFIDEIKTVDHYSFAVAVERVKKEVGLKEEKGRKGKKSEREECTVDSGVVVGVAFCFSGAETFYLSLLSQEVGFISSKFQSNFQSFSALQVTAVYKGLRWKIRNP